MRHFCVVYVAKELCALIYLLNTLFLVSLGTPPINFNFPITQHLCKSDLVKSCLFNVFVKPLVVYKRSVCRIMCSGNGISQNK